MKLNVDGKNSNKLALQVFGHSQMFQSRGPTEHFVRPSQAEPPTSLVTFRKLYFALCVF